MQIKTLWLGGVIAAGLVLGLSAQAQAASVVVSATTDIFLASQSSVSGYFGTDTAPTNSPVALSVAPGATLTFAASGSTSVDGSCFAGADGGCYSDQSGFSPAPASGTYNGPADALIGVFLGAGGGIVANGPASLDYQTASNFALTSQSPALNQIFFIGDGLTGTGAGTVQQFFAPTGATTLYIAVADSIGGSNGNVGALTVDFTGATLAASVPEPSSWALMIMGVLGVGLALRTARKGRGAATA